MKLKFSFVFFLLVLISFSLHAELPSQDKYISISLKELNKLGEDLKAEQKMFTDKQKDLEARERLYQTGFYTTLFAGIVSLLSVSIRSPHRKLEKQFKELEILEKQKILENMGVNLSDMQ